MAVRKLTIQKLSEKFPEKAEAIEKKFNSNVVNIAKKMEIKASGSNKEFVDLATQYYYDMLGMCMDDTTKPTAVKELNAKIWGFDSSFFTDEENAENAIIERMVVPPKVQKGIVKCKECGSRNTSCLAVQTRSGDEMATIFVDCGDCRLFDIHRG